MEQSLSELVTRLEPDHWLGAVVYLAIAIVAASLLSRALRAAVHLAMTRGGHIDRTTISFLQQFGSALIWVVALILYAHLIPVLHSLGTALLAGASVASVVIGLAAQSTLGNLVAGISITIYRPFPLGDTLQIAAPTGTETGVVDAISLGYTTLRSVDDRRIVVPNNLAASQVTINLSHRQAMPAPLAPIVITLARSVALDEACQDAVRAARQVENVDAVDCEVVRIEPEAAVLELRVRAVADAGLRSRLLTALAHRFEEGASAPRARSIA